MAPKTSQYRAIYGLASRIWGRSEANEQLHDLVYREYRKESLRDLSVREAEGVIGTLRSVDNNLPFQPGSSTLQQRKKISKLGFLLSWSNDGIRSFMEELTGQRDWNDLSQHEADKVIQRMHKILKGKLEQDQRRNYGTQTE